ncbi:MAG TPA: flagellar biosynthetic protein FliR [Povalibacter sp.]|uniref:flagellar biosynthetic protein FliR n=1 Tax=Povalibacter sp. TaxID=1962978 RepID=UPI002BADE6DC|nr:flagellar biosynthetic protein FliR [Povalibacter sp.]HMN43162.1 flagellar biosynthetic protein FliR [Povalibacter sp.]
MELALQQLPSLLTMLWWPFCRVLGMFSAAPIIGENMVPVSVRVLLSLALAVVLMPTVAPVAVEPLSMHALLLTAEQALIGFGIGLAFHLTVAIIMVLGFMVSSQMGLSMAVMNDPMSGTSSDVVSALLYVLCIFVFFSIDGHLVLAGVVGASFRAWPVGGGVDFVTLQSVAYNVAWVFSAALLLAIPVIFSALVVQLGFGFLNRVAPALNLYALGFSAVTVFGLYMLGHIVRSVPEHYVRMTRQVLEMLRQGMH